MYNSYLPVRCKNLIDCWSRPTTVNTIYIIYKYYITYIIYIIYIQLFKKNFPDPTKFLYCIKLHQEEKVLANSGWTKNVVMNTADFGILNVTDFIKIRSKLFATVFYFKTWKKLASKQEAWFSYHFPVF